MTGLDVPYVLLALGALIGLLSTYPFVATTIDYRHRDNGLAYILFVLGVGIWNGLFLAQYLSTDPTVTLYFYSLSVVGALLAGLGWFLFASTASSTPSIPARRPIFALVATLVGVAITLTMTSPVHSLYWVGDSGGSTLFAAFSPQIGFWLTVGLLVGLFAAGTALFAVPCYRGRRVRYTYAYTVFGTGTMVAIVGSSTMLQGGLSVASLVVVCLAMIGWLQAKRWSGFRMLDSWLASNG